MKHTNNNVVNTTQQNVFMNKSKKHFSTKKVKNMKKKKKEDWFEAVVFCLSILSALSMLAGFVVGEIADSINWPLGLVYGGVIGFVVILGLVIVVDDKLNK